MPFLALLTLALMVTALIDAITRREDQVKHLPKFAWILLIIVIPLVGSVLWFTIGREWSAPRETMSFGDPRRWSKDEPAPSPAPAPRPNETRSTAQQLADLEREIEIAELEEQVRRRRAAQGDGSAAGAAS
ncbi:PLD nuclease N-terminal domain-containing protein [Microbacterium sp. NPDC091313]